MDLLKGNLKKIYFKYLFASFGSALIAWQQILRFS